MLVYDRAGREIISPLLNVAQLRRNGVTLHMLVRLQIIDVPIALYSQLITYLYEIVALVISWILIGNLFPTYQLSIFVDQPLQTFSALRKTAGI